MAIDSRQKRQSAAGAGRPWARTHDTSTVDEAWRLAAGNVYSGNALSAAGGVTPIGQRLHPIQHGFAAAHTQGLQPIEAQV